MTETRHIISHPDYLLSAIAADRCSFALVNERTYRQSAFLDHRMQPMPQRAVSVATRTLLDSPGKLPRQPADLIIAHSSFCASTLLARTLDADDVLVLREPQVLGQLANLRRTKTGQDGWYQELCPLGLRLLSKRYQAQQKLVIKFSNYANNLLFDLLRDSPGTRLLLLLGSLDDLMISMHKHAGEATLNLPKFLHAMLIDQPSSAVPPQHLPRLDLMQQTALLWHLQVQQFKCLVGAYGQRTRLLVTGQFMTEPLATVTATDRWIAADRSESERQSGLTAMMGVDAKARGGEPTSARTTSRLQLRAELSGEIMAAREWATHHGLSTEPTALENVQYLL